MLSSTTVLLLASSYTPAQTPSGHLSGICGIIAAVVCTDKEGELESRGDIHQPGQERSFEVNPEFGDYFLDDRDAKEFCWNTRSYHKALAFMSIGGSGRLVGMIYEGRGPPTYKIQGEVYHQLRSLLPGANCPPVYIDELC
ncbi:hypothetical protein EDB92DRAFT_948464 [Lactarius akahatsu]|uniref:Uncharacterized protein n=1 Tax=Lactarius akahatsu TaxID=416441 RepID=A0AAD4LU24_9AGAM|nr:hypothetical protein EDB92DRAFT_948464 [Lactarius akahatsu]